MDKLFLVIPPNFTTLWENLKKVEAFYISQILKYDQKNRDELENLPKFFMENEECTSIKSKFGGIGKNLYQNWKTLYRLLLTIEELTTNTILYGKKEAQNDLQILLKIFAEKNILHLKLIDNGVPFNPLMDKKPKQRSFSQDMDFGGMGIELVKHSVDQIKYVYQNQKNHLYLALCFSSEKIN